MKSLAVRWIIILVSVVVLIYLGRTFETRTLSETAIVVGLAIDYEDGSYLLSTQTVTSTQQGGESPSNNTNIVTSAKEATVSLALSDIGEKLGLLISLSHCNVVIFSNEAITMQPLSIIETLIQSWHLPEKAIIVAADSSKDILMANTPSVSSSSFYIQMALLQNIKAGNITSLTAKDMIHDLRTRSATMSCAFIERNERVKEETTEPQQSDKKYYDFFFTKNIAVTKDGILTELNLEMANAYNYYDRTEIVGGATETVETEGRIFEFVINDKQRKIKADGSKVKAEIELDVAILEARSLDGKEKVDIHLLPDKLSEKAVLKLKENLTRDLQQLFEYSKATNIDFMRLEEAIYHQSPSKNSFKGIEAVEFEPSFAVKLHNQ